MDQGDNNIVFPEIPVKASAAANELVDFTGDFDAAEAGSHDDKIEMPPATIGIT